MRMRNIAEILIAQTGLDPEDIAKAAALQEESGDDFCRILLKQKLDLGS